MSYPFDATLIPNVLADAVFQRTGIYIGSSNGLFYCVADPRRHDVDVWEKLSGLQILRIWGNAAWPYMLSALHQGFASFTNGPMMSPPSPAPSGWRRAWEYFITLMGLSAQWSPVNTVVHGSTIIGVPNGPPYNNAWFGRSGSGKFSFYRIAADPAPGTMVESMGGLTRIVAAGEGLWSFTLATDFLAIGASDAVALDGSDSVTCGCGTSLLIRCAAHNDAMQRFGLCVRQ
jgi:hypothetical protein